MRTVILALSLGVGGCSAEPAYTCYPVPDRNADYAQMDNIVEAASNGKTKPSSDLEEARKLQQKADDLIRENNRKHGC